MTTTGNWREYGLSADDTHHVDLDRPAYDRRFVEVLKFHVPGLAPVVDDTGAYHITPDGSAAYVERHLRTFGFYDGVAAVHSPTGWYHIRTDGTPIYTQRQQWCGNFQEGRCPVRDANGRYYHIRTDGAPAYAERYRYASDFRDGYAVVQNDAGDHTHIDINGVVIHGKWLRDLDVFYKGYARAADEQGWHHVDLAGQPLYHRRFQSVEPFYNGQARVEGHDGSLSVVDEQGHEIVRLRNPSSSTLEQLSGDMVGVWKTQTMRAAVELGVFDLLPATTDKLERILGLAPSYGARLMRALRQLGLVRCDVDEDYHATEKGAHPQTDHDLSLTTAASHWGNLSHRAWGHLVESLRTGKPAQNDDAADFFSWLAGQPDELAESHRMFATYARHDYASLPEAWDFGAHDAMLDAGGGTGELSFALLREYPNMQATVMDRAEVGFLFDPPHDVSGRARFVAANLFERWPLQSGAVTLARVLHDWPDDEARRILTRAREAMPAGGGLYVVEMILDETTGSGGLLDLNMLVMTGGRERTVREFHELLTDTGFRLSEVVPTSTVNSLIVAEAV